MRRLGADYGYEPPAPLPQDGVYRPGRLDAVPLAEYRAAYCDDAKPTAALLFYRAHWVSGNLEFVDAVVDALERRGCNTLPVFCLQPARGRRRCISQVSDGCPTATRMWMSWYARRVSL